MQSQKAASAHLQDKQILPFDFARQYTDPRALLVVQRERYYI